MTIAVLAACVVSTLTVRRTFGYSFADLALSTCAARPSDRRSISAGFAA